MKGIKLKTVEERKYEVIKKLVLTCGNKKKSFFSSYGYG